MNKPVVPYALPKARVEVKGAYTVTKTSDPVCTELGPVARGLAELQNELEGSYTPFENTVPEPIRVRYLQRLALAKRLENWKRAKHEKPTPDAAKVSFKGISIGTQAVPDETAQWGVLVEPSPGVRRTEGEFTFTAAGIPTRISSADTNRGFEVVQEVVTFALKVAVAALTAAEDSEPATACDVALFEAAHLADKELVRDNMSTAEFRVIAAGRETKQEGTFVCLVDPATKGPVTQDLVTFDSQTGGLGSPEDANCVFSSRTSSNGGTPRLSLELSYTGTPPTLPNVVDQTYLDDCPDTVEEKDRGKVYEACGRSAVFRVPARAVATVVEVEKEEGEEDVVWTRARREILVPQAGQTVALPAGRSFGKSHVKLDVSTDENSGGIRALKATFGKEDGPSLGSVADAGAGVVDAGQARAKASGEEPAPKTPLQELRESALEKCAAALAEGEWSQYCGLIE